MNVPIDSGLVQFYAGRALNTTIFFPLVIRSRLLGRRPARCRCRLVSSLLAGA